MERVGTNPKTYLRIVRFNKAYNIRNRYPGLDWLRIAMECDYHDYQHLVRDYIEFTGLRPREFHALERQSPECILGLAEEIYKSRGILMT
jgi:AraC-like DNA-binding protein